MLIKESINFFDLLLETSPLFHRDLRYLFNTMIKRNDDKLEQNQLISLQELKLYTCVECQKLRSAIRFDWLTKCLEIIFEINHERKRVKYRSFNGKKSRMEVEKSDKCDWMYQSSSYLPPLVEQVEPSDSEETIFFRKLAQLMGLILRRHFLEPALLRWCAMFETTCFGTSQLDDQRTNSTKIEERATREIQLAIDVHLMLEKVSNGEARSQILTISQPNEQLKSSLSFMVDELAGVLKDLPRLETQLEATSINVATYIPVLHPSDNLLLAVKSHLWKSIDGSQSINKFTWRDFDQSDQVAAMGNKDNKWIDIRYFLVVEIVNKFRLGEGPAQMTGDLTQISNLISKSYTRIPTDTNGHSVDQNEDFRILRLRQSCSQIRTLDQVDELLRCHLDRYQDFGFVMLDYEPLRLELIKNVLQERRLIIRLNLDDLIKLMEKVRLHFDEIELGIDLETAIEDYLADRWQAKQLQTPSGASRLLLAGVDDDEASDGNALGDAELADELEAEVENIAGDANESLFDSSSNETTNISDQAEREENSEKLLEILLGSGANQSSQMNDLQQQRQLMSLVGRPGSNKSTSSSKARRSQPEIRRQFPIAPLIECRLLAEKYEYSRELLDNGLDLLNSDVLVVFEGLIFLSEFVSTDQLEPSQAEMITELASRSREFNMMLGDSLSRLNHARSRLMGENQLRSRVLSKLLLEFHQLARTISKKMLTNDDTPVKTETVTKKAKKKDKFSAVSSGSANQQAIRQLDSIQEVSAWSQKLETRCEFLAKINTLLLQELDLLSRANLHKMTQDKDDSRESERQRPLSRPEHELHEEVIEIWRPLVASLSKFWRLVEVYETQLVKWLNSDIKRLNFTQIELMFGDFEARLSELKEIVSSDRSQLLSDCRQEVATTESHEVLASNVAELESRFKFFSKKRLPVFRFLANEHLVACHWQQVAELASQVTVGGVGSIVANPQLCTTVAQLLELNVDKFIDKLEEISRQATIEHELTMFLLAEVEKSPAERNQKLNSPQSSTNWLANWSDKELEVAAQRFINIKLQGSNSPETTADSAIDCSTLGRKLVAIHTLVRRYLKVSYEFGLLPTPTGFFTSLAPNSGLLSSTKANHLVLRSSCSRLTSSSLVDSSMFVEFLKFFTMSLLDNRDNLAEKMKQIQDNHLRISRHIDEIETLINEVHELEQNELKVASQSIEVMLSKLEGEIINLELEHESLATKEALALERQREALKIREDCVRQIIERAIPAIRAATRALDCLDDRCLRTLRSLRPNPPAAVRLVLEAVCLLRSCKVNQSQIIGRSNYDESDKSKSIYPLSPVRTFDAVKGQVIEDYWPIANRMINGTHSMKFIHDLKTLDKKSIPNQLMRLIRRRYLSSHLFNLEAIEKVSHECALLAKWLIAVDVFDRVINVVKPNYSRYMDSERDLSGIFSEVASRRKQIELVSVELQRLEDSSTTKLANRVSLAESLNECRRQLSQTEATRSELLQKKARAEKRLENYVRRQRKLDNKCLLEAANLVYLCLMQNEEQAPLRKLICKLIIS